MGLLTLSKEDMEHDIAQYHVRIRSCRDRLAVLPVGKDETRKDKATKRVLASELTHISTMVGYARDALGRLEKSDSD